MTIKPVADLYLITYEDGKPYRYTRDADEAIDAIEGGFKVKEFVSLENHRAAMLQGAEQPQNAPQNIPENIPSTQFKPVADLYGLTSPTGSETSFTFDAVEARDFVDGGWSCQEYVGLERFQKALLQGADTELQRKAAIHDALCEKYNVESLADFVDWQRNHIAELEAAPPAPVGEGETAVMPDYQGYTMTQRECFQAGKEAGLAEAGSSPVIPDGWVACSERMPEPKRWLALYGARVFTHGDERGQPYHKSCVDQGYLGSDGQFYLLNWDQPGTLDDNYNNDLAIATHWMYWELPAPPQQEVK